MNNSPLHTAEASEAKPKTGWLLPLASLPFLFFLIIPILALFVRIPVSDLFHQFLKPQVEQALLLSMVTTAITTVLTVVLGTPVAYLLARRNFTGRSFLETFIELPIVLPPAVAGIALLAAFGRRGLFGPLLSTLGINIAFTPIAVVMAQIFVASPFYIKSAAAGFSSIDRELEQSAAVDGASLFKVFRTITVPLSSPALLGGAMMTWARALGEFGATIIFAGNFPGRTQTMPLAIYIGFEIDLDQALLLGIILLTISFTVLAVVKLVIKKRLVSFLL